MNEMNKECKLQDLLKEDKEMLLGNMAKDRTPEAVRVLLEKELDRIAYRCGEGMKDQRRSVSAQAYLRILKNALPFISSVNEVREWKRDINPSPAKKIRPVAIAAVIAGLGLMIVPLVTEMLSRGGAFSLKTLMITIAGALCMFLGGLFIRPHKKTAKAETESKQEFLVDPGAVYQSLWGAFIITDKCIEDDMAEYSSPGRANESAAEGVSDDVIELLSGLLETAYVSRGHENAPGNEEIISAIKYYLHDHNIEAADYTGEKENRFEILPSKRAGTIRPALVCGDKLLKKGLASSAGE